MQHQPMTWGHPSSTALELISMGCFIPAIAQTCRDEETVARNRRNARNAWQYNLRFAVRMKLTPAETAQINEKLQQLEYEPRKLGEFSKALRKRANRHAARVPETQTLDACWRDTLIQRDHSRGA